MIKLLFTVVILYLCLAPQPLGDNQGWFSFPGADKVVHFGMFFALTAAYIWDYSKVAGASRRNVWVMVAIAVVAIAIGGLIEVLQELMRLGRSMDMLDLLADAAGVVVALGAMVLCKEKL